jgi:inosose dehydratase
VSSSAQVGFNPLPWYATDKGFDRQNAPPLPEIYHQIHAAGFDAVHTEVPDGMPVRDYRQLLADTGLGPAPGYFQAAFSAPALAATEAEQARLVAAEHAELGLTRVFIADRVAADPRIAAPAQGIDPDPARLDRIIENLARAAEVMVAEGVTPCLHQHVGSWIETPQETEAVLAAISPDLLLFGPDTGHLAWAGADPADIIRRHLDRVGAVHLKDVRADVSRNARAAGLSYREATAHHVFTEPGRGDLDLVAVLRVLSRFDGWFVVEVDVPDQPTPAETALVSARWVRRHMIRNGSADG